MWPPEPRSVQGVDGLSSEFYKLSSKQLAAFLLQVYLESFKKGSLPATLSQGLTTLIPEPEKTFFF